MGKIFHWSNSNQCCPAGCFVRQCYFRICYTAFKRYVGVSMGIEPPPFWINLLLYFLNLNLLSIFFGWKPPELPDIMVNLYSKIISSFRRKIYWKTWIKSRTPSETWNLFKSWYYHRGWYLCLQKRKISIFIACMPHPSSLILSSIFHDLTISWRRPLPYRNSPLICSANQWIGFYMITALVMKDLIFPEFLIIARKIYLDYLTSFLVHLHDIEERSTKRR